MHEYDRSSKWLIQHHGDAILYLAGAPRVQSWRPLQAEVVQPRQLPDGILEVRFPDQPAADLVIVEIATYAEPRLLEQVERDAMLVYLDRRVMPEVLTLVLQPRGDFRLTGTREAHSRLGWSRLQVNWRVVELWTMSAEELLAADDLGVVPWVPLTQFDGPPEPVFQRCRDRIDQEAAPHHRANLLAVTQVLTRLRYNDPSLLTILGGSRIMIESPLIQEIVARTRHEYIRYFLEARFGSIPPEIGARLEAIVDEQKLRDLAHYAALCPDLESFRAELSP
jgi:hypothetical protein